MRHSALLLAAAAGVSPMLCSMAKDGGDNHEGGGTPKSDTGPGGVQANSNPNPNLSQSGLDTQGQFRIGERISIAVRGSDIVLRQATTGREVVVSEPELEGVLVDTYFTEHKGGDATGSD